MPRSLTGLPVLDFETLDVSTSVVTLTQAKYDRTPPAVGAHITVDTAPIRWRDDGGDPSSSVGHFATPTQPPIILDTPARLAGFRAIRQGASDAKVRVSYLGRG